MRNQRFGGHQISAIILDEAVEAVEAMCRAVEAFRLDLSGVTSSTWITTISPVSPASTILSPLEIRGLIPGFRDPYDPLIPRNYRPQILERHLFPYELKPLKQNFGDVNQKVPAKWRPTRA